MAKRIDTHHHIVPDFYREAIVATGGDPSGWIIPEWSIEQAKKHMDQLEIEKAYLSVTAPGAKIYSGISAREFARKLNDYTIGITREEPHRFGIFASLPSLTDVEGALQEIDYAYHTLRVDGFIFFTSYGDHQNPLYLGHEIFDPIWAKVNSLRTVVFIHPSEAPSGIISKYLPQPGIDYPHETARTAADLVTSGQRAKYPDVKIILSHGGGTLPVLASRIAAAARMTGCPTSPDQMLRDFRSFYYDLALVASDSTLAALLAFADHDKIVYGSDVPYAPLPAALAVNQSWESYLMKNHSHLLDLVNRENAKLLFGNQK